MTELELFAIHYKKLGLNITCISNIINEQNFYSHNILKAPNHKWKHLFSEKLTEMEYENYDWDFATGVGCVTGYQDLRVIDIDGCTNFDFLENVLLLLELPINYEWVATTGSRNGFHIFTNSNKFENLSNQDVVTTYPPKEQFKNSFEKIEILWNTNVVLPPSIHKTGNSYSFLNCKFPKSQPKIVKHRLIGKLIKTYLKAEMKVIGQGYGESLYEIIHPVQLNNFDEIEITESDDKIIFCIIDIVTDDFIISKMGDFIYPNIVQVAWLLMDIDGRIIKKDSELINYPNITLTEAFQVNNINIELVKKIGKSPHDVFKKLIKDIKCSNFIVAHNLDFDIPILQNQFRLYQMQDVLRSKSKICTMKETVNYCSFKLGNGEMKLPKLTELYERIFAHKIQQSHNAEADVLLIAKCFRALLEKNIIILDNMKT